MGKIATCDHFRMNDYLVIGATAGVAPFIVTEAGSTDAAYSTVAGGLAMALAATSEAENLMLSMGDVLRYDIDDLIRVEFLASITTASAVGITCAFGLGSAANADEDALTANALFKVEGSLAVVCETDVYVTNSDD